MMKILKHLPQIYIEPLDLKIIKANNFISHMILCGVDITDNRRWVEFKTDIYE